MPLNKAIRICTHIKVNGIRCGSPALHGEHFCYFHQRMIRGVRTPPQSRLHPMALLEDEESIQASLMEIINALVRNTIDLRRAQLILRALHIAARNTRRANFEVCPQNIVQEVPQYPAPAPPPKPPEPALAQAGALARVRLSRARLRKLVDNMASQPASVPQIDPTRPKPPQRVTSSPVVTAQAVHARVIRDVSKAPGETRSPGS